MQLFVLMRALRIFRLLKISFILTTRNSTHSLLNHFMSFSNSLLLFLFLKSFCLYLLRCSADFFVLYPTTFLAFLRAVIYFFTFRARHHGFISADSTNFTVSFLSVFLLFLLFLTYCSRIFLEFFFLNRSL